MSNIIFVDQARKMKMKNFVNILEIFNEFFNKNMYTKFLKSYVL